MKITFRKVKTSRHKKGTCPVCEGKVTRSKTFENTINPWNKNADGTVKTYSQVLYAVNKQADEWNPDFTHGKCREDSKE